jgi:2-polyprenyl-6-methoxyphenol hydroxylase-like FAD-dependent oxidoreductase
MSRDIALIGAGFTSLALALALTRRGISYKIYEKSAELEQSGFGIAMGPNSVAALQAIHPELRRRYDKCAKFDRSQDNYGTWMKFRYGMENHPFDEPSGNGSYSMKFPDVIADVKARGAIGEWVVAVRIGRGFWRR